MIHFIKTEYIFNEPDKQVGNVFMAWFPYTTKKFLLPDLKSQLNCFELMRYISDLVLAIHGVNQYRNGERNHLPITGENFVDCDEGRALLASILEAQQFVDNNPGWFANRFSRRISLESGVDLDGSIEDIERLMESGNEAFNASINAKMM